MAQLLSVRAAAVAFCFTTLGRTAAAAPYGQYGNQTAWWQGVGCCRTPGGGRSKGSAISKLKGKAYLKYAGCVDGCAAEAAAKQKVLWAIDIKKSKKLCTCYYEPQDPNSKKKGCKPGPGKCIGLELESAAPSTSATSAPSKSPTSFPTESPTDQWSSAPTSAPTAAPSSTPSCSFSLMPVTDAITWGVLKEHNVPYTDSDLYFLDEQNSTGFDQKFPAYTAEQVQDTDNIFNGYPARGGCRHTYRNDTMDYTEVINVMSNKRKPFTLAKCKHECMTTPWCTGIEYQWAPCTQSNLVSMTEINTCNEGCKQQGKCPTGKGKHNPNPCLLFKTPNINAAEIKLKIKKKKTTISDKQSRCFKKLCLNAQ